MAQKGKRNKDHQLLMALACGATAESAARQVNISESTVFRRLRNTEFSQQLQQTKSEMVQRTASMLTASGMESVKTLLELQKASNTGPVRLGAARAVLEIGMRAREFAELEGRLAMLEQLATQNAR
jgi:hypothetical protein